jgi:hypothetical protein
VLPGSMPPLVASACLTGGVPQVVQNADGIEVMIAAADRHPIDTIVKLAFDGPVEPWAMRVSSRGSLTTGKTVMASNWMIGFEPEKAVDGDLTTAWRPQQVDGQAWLDVDLGRPETFDRVEIHIENAAPVRGQAFGFTLEAGQPDGSWRRFWQGGIYGSLFARRYEPVTARRVRLRISAPAVRQFDLFAP